MGKKMRSLEREERFPKRRKNYRRHTIEYVNTTSKRIATEIDKPLEMHCDRLIGVNYCGVGY